MPKCNHDPTRRLGAKRSFAGTTLVIDTKPRPPEDSPSHAPGSIGWTKALTRQMLSASVVSITAPGGRDRRSVRLELDDGRTVIATRRESLDRAEHEAALLTVLHREGAPVPEVLGFREGLLLQADAGRNRLSSVLTVTGPAGSLDLARAAIEALERCRTVAEGNADVVASLPGLGTRSGWAEELVSRAFFLSGDLKLAAPDIDADALAASLAFGPKRFTRWDARLGNAAVQPDGSVVWFDWDIFGRRAGVEDISWLIADNYWSFDRTVTEALLEQMVPDAALRDLTRRMAVLIAIGRLGKIRERIVAAGWAAPEITLREDRIGAVPEVIVSLCSRMAELCFDDRILTGFVPWFSQVAEGMKGLDRPEAP